MTMLRKIVVMTVLMIFVLGMVPLAFAERGDAKGEMKKELRTEVKVKAENGKSRTEVRTTAATEASDNSEDDSAESASTESIVESSKRKERTPDTAKIRERVSKAKVDLKAARVKYEEMKGKYKDAKERYDTERGTLQELKDKARCTSDSEDCKAKKSDLKKGVAQHLLKTNELIARSLEKLTNRVEDSNVLTEDQKVEALASISELESTLIAEKERVLAFSENTTNGELRDAIQNLKHVWQDIRKEQRKIISMLISGKLEKTREKLDQFSASMLESIDRLKTEGKDTTELEALQADFAGKIEALKTASPEDAVTLLQEAKELLRQFKALEEQLKEEEAPEAENETETPEPENNATASITEEEVPAESASAEEEPTKSSAGEEVGESGAVSRENSTAGTTMEVPAEATASE